MVAREESHNKTGHVTGKCIIINLKTYKAKYLYKYIQIRKKRKKR